MTVIVTKLSSGYTAEIGNDTSAHLTIRGVFEKICEYVEAKQLDLVPGSNVDIIFK